MAERAAVCVVLHDVADATLAACERVQRALDEVAPVPLTLLAVPRYHGQPASAALEAWLGAQQATGHELALHGWTHRDDGQPRGLLDRLRRRVYTRGEGEFCDIAAAEAAWRLQQGRDWFAQHGWALHGFVAPAWLLGPGAWAALRAQPAFGYTATLGHVHGLRDGRRWRSRGVVYSSSAAWRRGASVAWAAFNARSLRANPLLRLELHPADADHAGIRGSWQRVLEGALREREPMTMARCVARPA
jgi:predicted deacetylase